MGDSSLWAWRRGGVEQGTRKSGIQAPVIPMPFPLMNSEFLANAQWRQTAFCPSVSLNWDPRIGATRDSCFTPGTVARTPRGQPIQCSWPSGTCRPCRIPSSFQLGRPLTEQTVGGLNSTCAHRTYLVFRHPGFCGLLKKTTDETGRILIPSQYRHRTQ